MTTIRDVSKRAGVSVATVSRAFSAPERLTKKTLEKVLAAAEELQYTPNSLAKIFRANRTHSVVVMVPDLSNSFFYGVIAGIERVASQHGYSLLLSDTKDDADVEASCLELLHGKRVDGIIQLGSTSIEALKGADVDADFPFVHAIECDERTKVPTVAVDNVGASHEITQHLLDLGHREFFVIGGPEQSGITADRLQGIRRALRLAGIRLPNDRVAFGAFSIEEGVLHARSAIQNNPEVSAIIAMSDDLAVGALREAKRLGRAIPSDISIVGFDDIPYSAYTEPEITTIAQPSEKLGRKAMELLLDQLQGESISNRNVLLTAKLVVRASAAAIS